MNKESKSENKKLTSIKDSIIKIISITKSLLLLLLICLCILFLRLGLFRRVFDELVHKVCEFVCLGLFMSVVDELVHKVCEFVCPDLFRSAVDELVYKFVTEEYIFPQELERQRVFRPDGDKLLKDFKEELRNL